MLEFCCVSVVGGWQTAVKSTGYRFGPVFNSCNDLWSWQGVHLYGTKGTVVQSDHPGVTWGPIT